VGDAPFAWVYSQYPWPWAVTTKEIQEQEFLDSWRRLELLLPEENIRLFAALNYFHIACRLPIVGINPWEFMGEALLNLSKVLEILFPGPEGQTLNAAREGLRQLDYADEDIEWRYITAMALRNELDVAHVSLVTLSQEELENVHTYTEQAEDYFREMLSRVIDRIAAGNLDLPLYEPRTGHIEVIRRISAHLHPNEEDDDGPEGSGG
jgi:hypothetical protein